MSDFPAMEALCENMGVAQPLCVNLLDRLVNLGAVPVAAPVEELGNLVDAFEQLLLKYRRYRNEPFHVQCILYDRITKELWRLNMVADELSKDPLEWKKLWETTRKKQYNAMMKRVSRAECLVDKNYTLGMMAEALAVLQFELGRANSEQTRTLSYDVVKRLATTIKTIPGVPVQPARMPAWFIPSYDIKLRYLVASGSFGSMHRAEWNDKPVFVKTLHADANGPPDALACEYLEREVSACFLLKNRHLVRVVGACHVSSPPFIVYAQSLRRNLTSFVVSSPHANVWRLLYETALGLQYLHRHGMVHGRLSIRDIVVDAKGTAKISGYGLIKTRRSFPSRPSTSAHYRAPECRQGGGNESPATDVFSLAMCIVHAITQQLPFGDLDTASILKGPSIPDRPSIDVMSEEAWALIEKMAQASPAARCLLDEVVATLRVFADAHDTLPTDEAADAGLARSATGVSSDPLDASLSRLSVVPTTSHELRDDTRDVDNNEEEKTDVAMEDDSALPSAARQETSSLRASSPPTGGPQIKHENIGHTTVSTPEVIVIDSDSEEESDCDAASSKNPGGDMDDVPMDDDPDALSTNGDQHEHEDALGMSAISNDEDVALEEVEGVPASPPPDTCEVRRLLGALQSLNGTSERVRILKALYRCVQEEASHEKVGAAGYELLVEIVCRESSTWKESVYAFSLLDRAQRRWNLVLESKEALEAKVKLPDQSALKVVRQGILSDDRATIFEACEMVACLALVSSVPCHDVVEPLMGLLSSDPRSPLDDERLSLQAIAADTLGYIALNPSYRGAIRDADGVKWLVQLLASRSADDKTKAAWCICCLTTMKPRDVHDALITGRFYVFPEASCATLCTAFHEAGATRLLADFLQGQLWAAAALGNIAVMATISSEIVESRALAALNGLMQRGDEEQKTAAVCTVSIICHSKRNATGIVKATAFHSTPTSLYELLCSGTQKQKIWATLAVYHLAGYPDVCERLQRCVVPLVAMKKSQHGPATADGATAGDDHTNQTKWAKRALNRLRANGSELQRSDVSVVPVDTVVSSDSSESSRTSIEARRAESHRDQQSCASTIAVGNEAETTDASVDDERACSDEGDYGFIPDDPSDAEVHNAGEDANLDASSPRRHPRDSASSCELDPAETTTEANDFDRIAVPAAMDNAHQTQTDQEIDICDRLEWGPVFAPPSEVLENQTIPDRQQDDGSHRIRSDQNEKRTTQHHRKRKPSSESGSERAKKKIDAKKTYDNELNKNLGIRRESSRVFRANQTIPELIERLKVPLTPGQLEELKALTRTSLSEQERERLDEEAVKAVEDDYRYKELPQDVAMRMFELARSTDCDIGVLAKISHVQKKIVKNKLATLEAIFKKM